MMKRLGLFTILLAATSCAAGCGTMRQWCSGWGGSSYDCYPTDSSSYGPVGAYGQFFGAPVIAPPTREVIPAPPSTTLEPIPENPAP